MQLLDDGKCTHLLIKWSKPYTLEEIRSKKADCSCTCFYKIIGVYGHRFKLFYIGKCIRQYLTTRIFQPDHLAKQASFTQAHKRHKLLVSLGDVEDFEEYSDTELDNIERLLIYSHSNEDFSYIKNKQCTLSHRVIRNYHIINSGWRKEGMYKSIGY